GAFGDSHIIDSANFTVDGSGNTATATVSTGASPPASCGGAAGCWAASEGSAPTAASGVSELYADSALHDWAVFPNNAGTKGIVQHTAAGSIFLTSNTTAIATSTLCDTVAGACDQPGLYRVEWAFSGGGTACSNVTAGSVTFLLTWKDRNAVTHSAVAMQMSS